MVGVGFGIGLNKLVGTVAMDFLQPLFRLFKGKLFLAISRTDQLIEGRPDHEGDLFRHVGKSRTEWLLYQDYPVGRWGEAEHHGRSGPPGT